MAGYTLPAPVAIDKNIRKPTPHLGFPVSTPYYGQPAGKGEIAIHLCMQVGELDNISTAVLAGFVWPVRAHQQLSAARDHPHSRTTPLASKCDPGGRGSTFLVGVEDVVLRLHWRMARVSAV